MLKTLIGAARAAVGQALPPAQPFAFDRGSLPPSGAGASACQPVFPITYALY